MNRKTGDDIRQALNPAWALLHCRTVTTERCAPFEYPVIWDSNDIERITSFSFLLHLWNAAVHFSAKWGTCGNSNSSKGQEGETPKGWTGFPGEPIYFDLSSPVLRVQRAVLQSEGLCHTSMAERRQQAWQLNLNIHDWRDYLVFSVGPVWRITAFFPPPDICSILTGQIGTGTTGFKLVA